MRVTSETIKAKVYPLMREAVEAGIAYGWQRAHKHVDQATPEALKQAMEDAVMNEIAERFIFSDDFD